MLTRIVGILRDHYGRGPMKAKTYVLIFGVLELWMGTNLSDGVAHFAHLGGMLGAFLLIRYWRGQPPFRGRRRF